ncbi:amidohydrolase family protein [Phytomonospora sp. NPDC050363]|uniref:amidohydrolase family protein n=1 Tax=Phytomonospora sp. NPDC050363 TaxID=3155642 RepID=UPI0033F41114
MTPLSRRTVLRSAAIAGGAALGVSTARPAVAADTAAIAFIGATVVDGTGALPKTDQTLVVRGDRIVALGPRERTPVPRGARIVEVAGKYVIPGLFDSHAHSGEWADISPRLNIANGVTTVRELFGMPHLHEWRGRVDAGTMLGPRSVIASRIIDGPATTGGPEFLTVVTTDAEARAAVRKARKSGADFVKVYSGLPLDLYDAVADESRRIGIRFAGHCPDAVPLAHAAAAGQRSVEHLYSTSYSASTREDEIRRLIAEGGGERGDLLGWITRIHRLEWMAAGSHSPRKAARLFATLVRRGVRMVPTLVVNRVMDRPGEVDTADPRLKYLPAAVTGYWAQAFQSFFVDSRTPAEQAEWHALLDFRLEFTGAMSRAGVPILVGTDGGDVPYVFPGFGVHDELANLVEAGLSPMRALQAATVEPARFLGLDRLLGTVEQGKAADLVVLDADPLADIANTRRIHAVVTRGRLITAGERTLILADVERAAAAVDRAVPVKGGCCFRGARKG